MDKFEGLTVRERTTGSPILDDALGWLDCRVEARLDTADRTVYLAEVVDARHSRATTLLTLKRTIELAPADKLRELKVQMERDIAVDAVGTRAWRDQLRRGRGL